MFWRPSETPQTSMLRMERRIAPRRNCAIAAEIVFDNGRQVVPCIIRNVSETGAKLELRTVVGVPPSFVLRSPGTQPQMCRVAWRAFKEMGVAFQPE